jgi:molybdate transport system substrate-binding protein
MWWGFIKNSFLVCAIFLGSCKRSEENRPAILYLASSLLPLKSSIEALAQKPLHLEFLSSAAIAQKISQGALCDGVVLADEEWQKFLADKNLVNPERKIIATNSLVLASKKKVTSGLLSLLHSSQKIIIADPAYVPLGRYTQMALEKLDLFDKLKTRFVLAHSAQMALILLKQDAAALAFLYQSDVDKREVFSVANIDKNLHVQIIYPFLVCRNAQREHQKDIENILLSTAFNEALRKYGFGVIDDS